MSLRDLNARHLRLVGAASGWNAIRSGPGVILVLLVFWIGLLMAHLSVTPFETFWRSQKEAGRDVEIRQVVDEVIEGLRSRLNIDVAAYLDKALRWNLPAQDDGGEPVSGGFTRNAPMPPWPKYLLQDRPAVLSILLFLLLWAAPQILLCGAFNQTSGEIQSKGLRFLLLRTERANIYFGRFLGTAAFSVVMLWLLLAVVVLYLVLKVRMYSFAEVVPWAAWGFVSIALIVFPYVALFAWVSGAVSSPTLSFLISFIVIVAQPAVAWILKAQVWGPLGYLSFLLPSGVQNFLLHPDLGPVLLAVLACLAYTAIFLALGYRHFSRRDL